MINETSSDFTKIMGRGKKNVIKGCFSEHPVI